MPTSKRQAKASPEHALREQTHEVGNGLEHRPSGYPPGLFDRHSQPTPSEPLRDQLLARNTKPADQFEAPSELVQRHLIPSRYPSSIRAFISGHTETAPKDQAESIADDSHYVEHESPSLNPKPTYPAAPIEKQNAMRTGTLSVIADELREVTGALTEGLGLLVRLPLFIAQGLRGAHKHQSDPSEIEIAASTYPQPTFSDSTYRREIPAGKRHAPLVLDLEEAARTLDQDTPASASSIALPSDQEQAPFLPPSLDSQKGAQQVPQPLDSEPFREPFLPADLRNPLSQPSVFTPAYQADNRLLDLSTTSIPSQSETLGEAANDLALSPPDDSPHPVRGRAICVAAVGAAFKSCQIAQRVARHTFIDAPRFAAGVIREAAESSRTATASPEAATATDEASLLTEGAVETSIAPLDTTTALDQRNETLPAAEQFDAAQVEMMIQSAIEDYAENLPSPPLEITPPPIEDITTETAVDIESAEVNAVGLEYAAPPFAHAEPEALEDVLEAAAEPAIYQPALPAEIPDWATSIATPRPMPETQVRSNWAQGMFCAGLRTLLLTTLGATLVFAVGFILQQFMLGYVALLGVLLMVGGIGGAMIAVMLLNEWLSALRFQLSASVRLMVRFTGVLAVGSLLLAFAASTIPREHWPI